MSQPPYPPQGGNEPGGDQPGSSGWNTEGGADDPTRRFDAPAAGGQRDQTQQFGQPPFGQPPYGQPQYGQPQYGQPPGQPPYGQPPYGQPWGPPGGPGGQPPKSNKNTMIALVVAAVVVLAAVGAGLFFLFRGSDPGPAASATTSVGPASTTSEEASPSEPSEPSPAEPPSSAPAPSETATGAGSIPPATVPPDGLGEDPALDELAQGCYDGDMQACDDLYAQSEADSAYELYGGTCAGRQDVSESDTVFCTDAFPGN